MYCSYCETDGCDLQPGSAVSDIDRLLYYWDRFIRSKRDEELREQEKEQQEQQDEQTQTGEQTDSDQEEP